MQVGDWFKAQVGSWDLFFWPESFDASAIRYQGTLVDVYGAVVDNYLVSQDEFKRNYKLASSQEVIDATQALTTQGYTLQFGKWHGPTAQTSPAPTQQSFNLPPGSVSSVPTISVATITHTNTQSRVYSEDGWVGYNTNNETKKESCDHTWKLYQGFNESYEYCIHCDLKRGDK